MGSIRSMASGRPQTLKERFAELIPAEIENVGADAYRTSAMTSLTHDIGESH